MKTTETCNLNCEHCFTSGINGKKIYFNPVKTAKWVNQLKADSVWCEFHGGEPFLAPVNGKLLQLHVRSNKDHSPSSETQVFTLRNWDDDEQFTDGNKTILAQKTVTGVQKNAVLTIDFRTGLASTANADTNEFTAGETLCIGMQNGFDTNVTTKYYFTAVFEFDFSSY